MTRPRPSRPCVTCDGTGGRPRAFKASTHLRHHISGPAHAPPTVTARRNTAAWKHSPARLQRRPCRQRGVASFGPRSSWARRGAATGRLERRGAAGGPPSVGPRRGEAPPVGRHARRFAAKVLQIWGGGGGFNYLFHPYKKGEMVSRHHFRAA